MVAHPMDGNSVLELGKIPVFVLVLIFILTIMMGRELCAIADLRLAQTPAGHYRPRIKPATSPSCTLLHRHHHQSHYHH